jgi:glycosyltransferase involved in cell wall biosynthesis
MITILMAVHNGEKYLAEQIESILNQTEADWQLIIQDDCSRDSTVKIANRYANTYPNKIKFHQNEQNSGSAKENFFNMLPYADTDYMMTCDQDDIWLPKKIKLTLDKMKQLEMELGTDKPILVHTDLQVVGSDLSVISNSMFHRQNLNSSKDKFNNILVQNIVTGCTLMVNRALLDMVKEVPQQAIMHDWWFALIASAFGKIGFIESATVLYRQHGHNEVGAKNARSLRYNLKRFLNRNQSQAALQNTFSQAIKFIACYQQQLEDSQLKLATAYAQLPSQRKIQRLLTLFHYHLWKNGLARKCGQILYMTIIR